MKDAKESESGVILPHIKNTKTVDLLKTSDSKILFLSRFFSNVSCVHVSLPSIILAVNLQKKNKNFIFNCELTVYNPTDKPTDLNMLITHNICF